MNILEILTELEKEGHFNKEYITNSGITPEAIFFMITEAKEHNTPNYEELYSVFDEIRKQELEQGRINIFEEHLLLGISYLALSFKVNPILLNALSHLVGVPTLDYELEERYFNEDKFYQFYMKRYSEFKQSNEITALKILNNLDIDSLKIEGEKFDNLMNELRQMVN